MKQIFIIVIVSLLCSCSTVQVVTDYDKNVNFENYKSYRYNDNLKTNLNELDNKRLFKQLDSVLNTKSLIFKENSSFYINISSSSYEISSNESLGVGVGGTGNNIGIGVRIDIGPDICLDIGINDK